MARPIVQKPVAHFYTRSKASWFCINDYTLEYENIPKGGIREVYEQVFSMSQKI